MQIKMLSTRRGSEDGFEVRKYIKEESYNVADTMARMFLRNGWAYNDEDETTLKSQSVRPTNPATLETIGVKL